MRRSALCIRILILAGLFVAGPLARGAAAVSVEDLVNLKANGLGDEVLIALIQADKSTFQLTADEIVQLRQRGLGDRVIVAMLNTAPAIRPQAPAEIPSTTAPASPPSPAQAPVNQNVVTQQVTVNTPAPATAYAVPVLMPVPVFVAPIAPLPPPVFWGFGGRLRGDAWRPVPVQPAPVPSAPAGSVR